MFGGYAGAYPAVQVPSWPQRSTPRPAPRRSTRIVRRTLCVRSGSFDAGDVFEATFDSLRQPARTGGAAP